MPPSPTSFNHSTLLPTPNPLQQTSLNETTFPPTYRNNMGALLPRHAPILQLHSHEVPHHLMTLPILSHNWAPLTLQHMHQLLQVISHLSLCLLFLILIVQHLNIFNINLFILII